MFNHKINNSSDKQDSINDTFERIENLFKIIYEKDAMIKDLAGKIEKLERQTYSSIEIATTKYVLEEFDINTTFVNPYDDAFQSDSLN